MHHCLYFKDEKTGSSVNQISQSQKSSKWKGPSLTYLLTPHGHPQFQERTNQATKNNMFSVKEIHLFQTQEWGTMLGPKSNLES